MSIKVLAATRSLVALIGLAAACAVGAQAQPVATPSDLVQQQQNQQRAQPLNNEPVWSEIRSGQPQTTQVRGRETNVLVMPEGETWRALRNGQLSIYAGWALVVLFMVILVFYWIKGPIPLHGPPTGRLINRFNSWERAVHWATAISFSILAITGLIILFGKSVILPLIGYTLFSWLATLGKNLHNFVGPLFVLCSILLMFTFIRDNFWRAYDFLWIRKFGGLLSGHDVPSGRFNAGEKLWFWGGLVFLGIIVSASGLVLDFPNFNQTRETMQIANIVHLTGASLFMLGAMGHIYMGTLGMKGAYHAMRTGYVDETWAKEHHLYWYEDVESGKLEGEGDVAPVPVQRVA
jgi:formate dehydrogenase subunit gamma